MAFPLLEAASSFAGRRVRPYLGIYYANRYSFSLRFSETARSHYGLGEALSILEVIPDSPAEFADLHVGDIIHSVNGKRVPEGPKAPETMSAFLRENLVAGELIPMIVGRGDIRHRMELIPTFVADFSLVLGSSQSVHAKATGKKVG